MSAVAQPTRPSPSGRIRKPTGLRPVQVEALEALAASVVRGVRRNLLVLPTGAGKTVAFANAPRMLRLLARIRTSKVLVLAHRGELLEQAGRTFQKWEKRARVGYYAASHRTDPREVDVLIASVNTLARAPHLDRLPRDTFDFIVIDEAHHAIEDSGYERVVEHFRGFEADGPLVTGWTATPLRADGKRLTKLFQANPYAKGLADGMAEGWLAPARWVPVPITGDLLTVATHGDFDRSKLAALMDQEPITCTMVAEYLNVRKAMFARGQPVKTIAFAVNRTHALHVVEALVGQGITAHYIGGDLPKLERRGLLQRFRRKEFEALVSVNLLLEGFDDDTVNVALDLKPTRSGVLAAQEFGRPIRFHPEKDEAIYIQAVPEHAEEARMVTVKDVFNIGINWDTASEQKRRAVTEGPIHEAVERIERQETAESILGEAFDEEKETWTPAQRQAFIAKALAEDPNLIVQLVEALPQSFRDSDIVWTSRVDKTFVIHTADHSFVAIHPEDLLGHYRITAQEPVVLPNGRTELDAQGNVRAQVREIGAEDSLDAARLAAERWVIRRSPVGGRLYIKSLAEPRMREPATPAQKAQVRALLPDLPARQIEYLRSGVAAKIIAFMETHASVVL